MSRKWKIQCIFIILIFFVGSTGKVINQSSPNLIPIPLHRHHLIPSFRGCQPSPYFVLIFLVITNETASSKPLLKIHGNSSENQNPIEYLTRITKTVETWMWHWWVFGQRNIIWLFVNGFLKVLRWMRWDGVTMRFFWRRMDGFLKLLVVERSWFSWLLVIIIGIFVGSNHDVNFVKDIHLSIIIVNKIRNVRFAAERNLIFV